MRGQDTAWASSMQWHVLGSPDSGEKPTRIQFIAAGDHIEIRFGIQLVHQIHVVVACTPKLIHHLAGSEFFS